MRLFVILLSVISFHCHSQTPFASLRVPGKISNLRGMMIDNDIFLSVELPSTNTKPTILSYFLHPDGTTTDIDFKALENNPIITGIRRGTDTYFYYLDGKSKIPMMKSLQVDKSGIIKPLAEPLEIPGKIYGTYVHEGDLFMLCALKKEFRLKLLRIHDGILANETNFALPFDLGKKKEDNVSFFDTSVPTSPKQASAPIKIIKDKDLIWIIIDEPIDLNSHNVTASSIFKTTVVKLDLLTAKTSIKSFFETEWNPFTSAILNGNLYRLVLEPKKSRIDLFNFESGKKIKTLDLIKGNEPGRDSTYARIGKYLKTEKDVKGANIVKRVLGNLFIVDSLSAADQLLTVGHYGDQMLQFVGLSDVLAIAMTATSLLVSELVQGPYSCVYYYYAGSTDTGYTATYRTPLLRQIIDDYEYNLLIKKVRFDCQGYLNRPDVTYAFYQRNKSKELEIVKFQK